VIVHGTARDLAEDHAGFAANGESMWTRRVAHPDADARFDHPAGRRKRPRLTLNETISQQVGFIVKLRNKLKIERDPTRVEKLSRDLHIKIMFVDRLLKEKTAR
jgi:hypothetical protein